MRATLLIAAALTAFAATPCDAAPPTAADRQALEALAERGDQVWNARDVDGMAGIYTADATLQVGASPILAGRDALRRYFAEAFGRREGTFRHVTRVEAVDLVAPDIAFTDNVVRVERADGQGGWTLVRTFRNNGLALRQGGDWRLAAVRAYPLP